MEVLGVLVCFTTMSRSLGDKNNSTMIANVVRQKTLILEPHSIEKGLEQIITRYQYLQLRQVFLHSTSCMTARTLKQAASQWSLQQRPSGAHVIEMKDTVSSEVTD